MRVRVRVRVRVRARVRGHARWRRLERCGQARRHIRAVPAIEYVHVTLAMGGEQPPQARLVVLAAENDHLR